MVNKIVNTQLQCRNIKNLSFQIFFWGGSGPVLINRACAHPCPVVSVALRDRPKTDFPFTAENETGVENGSSFSAVNENENENFLLFSAENETENETDEKYSQPTCS